MQLTRVAMELIVVDKYTMLAEFNNGEVVEFRLPWGLTDTELEACRFRTEPDLWEHLRTYAEYRRAIYSSNLHDYKCSKYGWDYSKRGY